MNSKQKIAGGGISIGLKGTYKVQVVNATTKEIVADYDWGKNLILNSGMDGIATANRSLAGIWYVGIAGTGSRPNSITSSTSEITQSGTSMFLNNTTGLPDFTSSIFTNGIVSYTASVNLGDVIIDSDNSQSIVRAIVDGFNLTVDTNYIYTTGKTFTIWKTSQTGLQAEQKRTQTYLIGAANNWGVVSESVVTSQRTYDFGAEASTVNYTEVGVGWDTVSNPRTTLSRILLPVSVSVATGNQLRLIYQMQTTYGPAGERYITPTIAGWPTAPSTTTAGSESIQNFSLLWYNWLTMGSTVNSSGDAVGFAILDPNGADANSANSFVSSASASLSVFNTSSARTADSNIAALSPAIYTPGSYTLYRTSSYGLNNMNIPNIRTMGIGRYGPVYGQYPNQPPYQAICFLFQEPQVKTNTQTLTLVWKWTWARVIQ
jgi:hypothetical protein